MARIRTIKPQFWSHPVFSRRDDSVRLGAIGILNIADDEGYFDAEPANVRSAIWPLDEDSSKARRVLDELSRIGYIEIRDHSDRGPIGRVISFSDHQRVDRPSPSKNKGYFASVNVRRALDEDSSLERKGKEGKGKEEKASAPSDARSPPAPSRVEQPGMDLEKIEMPQPAMTIPLVGGSLYPIYQAMLDEWQQSYPALDVAQMVRTIRQWNIDNPKNRKTKSGILRHINGWLAKEQNRAPKVAGNNGHAAPGAKLTAGKAWFWFVRLVKDEDPATPASIAEIVKSLGGRDHLLRKFDGDVDRMRDDFQREFKTRT